MLISDEKLKFVKILLQAGRQAGRQASIYIKGM
jgi:hypothetical protein